MKWDKEIPTSEGYYLFKCGETPQPELVFVFQRVLNYFPKNEGNTYWEEERIMEVYSDDSWHNLAVFHDNLTDPQWKKIDERLKIKLS